MSFFDTWKASYFPGIDSTYVYENIFATTKNAIYWVAEGLEEAGSKFFVPPNDPRGMYATPAGPHGEIKWQVQTNRIWIDFTGMPYHDFGNSDPRNEYSITEVIYGGPALFGEAPLRFFPWGIVGGSGIGSPFDEVWTEFNPAAGGSIENPMHRRKAIYPRSSTPHGMDFDESGQIPLVRFNREATHTFDHGSHKTYDFTATVSQPKSVGTIYIFDGASDYTPTHTIPNVNLSDLTPGKTFTAGGKTYTLGNARYHYELNEILGSNVLNA